MIEKLLFFFRINKELVEQNKLLQNSLNILQGEVNILKEWNDVLRNDKNKLEEIIFRKFGLVQSNDTSPAPQGLEQVRVTRNWKQIQSELEEKTRKQPDPVLTEQEQHWKEKIENQ